MLETIRQYAREKLIEAGEVEALADRHFATFAALAEAAEPELRGPAMVDWLDRMDADVENFDTALEWGLEAQPWEAVRMATALLAYWAVRVASTDNEARLVAAIEIARARTVGNGAADPADQALAARLLGEAARIWSMGGQAATALPWGQDALVLADASGDIEAELVARSGIAVATVFTGGGDDVQRWFREGVALGEQSGNWWLLGMAAGFAGASLAPFDPVASERLVLEADEAARRSGSPYAIGAVSIAHGRMLSSTGRIDEAVARYGIAIARFAELGDVRLGLAAKSDLAHALRRGGRLDEAAAAYRDTIGGWVHLGHRGAVANQLENIGYLAIDQDRPDRAARLLGAAEAIREEAAAPMAFDEEPELARFVERLRTMLPLETFEAAWGEGREMSLAAAVALARSD
jgi:tetratricopeptide (TPR) repeat protein